MDTEEIKKEFGYGIPKFKIGTRIGKITILGYDNKIHKYKCRCDCGNIIYRKTSHLDRAIKSKTMTSCGCNRKKDGLDIIGKKIGHLRVVSLAYHKRIWFYNCLCDCGNKKIVGRNSLLSGDTKSCGSCQKHGLSKTRIYSLWRAMKTRCSNPNTTEWKHYGGKGVSVCDEWKNDFMAFYDWSLRNGYNDTLTIDRIDTNGNYTPDNCRWTTYYVQSRNKTNNKWITYKGETKCLEDWAKTKNLTSSKLKQRLELYGWSLEKSLETPPMKNGRFITYKGITKNITEWAKELGIKPDILAQRLRAGWNIEKAFETKVNKNKSRSCRIKGGGLMNE